MAEASLSPPTTNHVVVIEAQPTPLRIDLTQTAVVVLDMQKDFGAKGVMFDHAGINLSMIQRAVGPTARVLTAARQARIPVVYLKMAFRPDLSAAGPMDAPNWIKHLPLAAGKEVQAPDGAVSRILIRDTWNTEILPDLVPQAGDYVLYKHRFSGFYDTELDGILKQLGAKYLLVTGCPTSICVESTIRNAMFRDYSCLLFADCTGERLGEEFQRSNHEASLFVIQTLLGWVPASEEFLKVITSAATAQTGP